MTLTINKTKLVSVSALAVLALSTFGFLGVSAWYSCNSSFPNSCSTTPSPNPVVSGHSVTDTATIYVSNYGNPPSAGSNPTGCTNSVAFGCVIYKLYYLGTSGSCNNGNPTGSTLEATIENYTTFVSKTGTGGGNGVTTLTSSATFSTTGFAAGSYVITTSYTGTGSSGYPSYKLPGCESFTVSAPLSGVPEFPLGSIGMVALIGMMIPLLFVMRSRFAKNLSL